MSAQDGGPAFPQPNQAHPGNPQPNDGPGMTLRQWYAGQALAGLMGLQTVYDNMADRDVAKAAYRLAEAMLAEDEKS